MPENTPSKMYDAAMKLKSEGNLEGCVDALKQILEVDPNHVQTHMALGGAPAETRTTGRSHSPCEDGDGTGT